MDNLSFYAQSLDNQSLDPMEVNNHPIEDDAERRAIKKDMSDVSLKGKKVLSEGSNAAFLHGDTFLLKTPSEQLDDGDRIAPILCYGRVQGEPWKSWDIVNALVGFAGRIGRTISEENQKTAHRGAEAILEAQNKNRMRRKRRRVVVDSLFIFGIILIIAFLYKK